MILAVAQGDFLMRFIMAVVVIVVAVVVAMVTISVIWWRLKVWCMCRHCDGERCGCGRSGVSRGCGHPQIRR